MSVFSFSELGEYHADGVPPENGEARAHGIFFDPDDMFDYLERGGLITSDESGVHTHPAVHIVLINEEPFDEGFAQVYIVDDY